MTEFAAFVTEPEANATIYHLSRDDTKALCGRDVSHYGRSAFAGAVSVRVCSNKTLLCAMQRKGQKKQCVC